MKAMRYKWGSVTTSWWDGSKNTSGRVPNKTQTATEKEKGALSLGRQTLSSILLLPKILGKIPSSFLQFSAHLLIVFLQLLKCLNAYFFPPRTQTSLYCNYSFSNHVENMEWKKIHHRLPKFVEERMRKSYFLIQTWRDSRARLSSVASNN